MSRKPKFRPVITRVKLDQVQAVLACNCFSDGGSRETPSPHSDRGGGCGIGHKNWMDTYCAFFSHPAGQTAFS